MKKAQSTEEIEALQEKIAELEGAQVRRLSAEQASKRAEQAIPKRRIWLPVAGMFVLLCMLVWLDEIVDLPHLLLGAPPTPINWREAITETVLIAGVGIFAVLRLIRDITEQVRAEQALRESERCYRLLAENVSDVIWTMDMDLQFIYISPSVTDMLGYSVEEMKAQTLEDVLTPASLEVAGEALAKALVAVELEDLYEFELNRKDGSTVWTEAKMALSRDPDGQPVGILGIARDFTKHKRAEEALQKTHNKLQTRVQKRTAELAKANEELQAEIAERKQAEEALRESEEKYRTILDNIEDGYFEVDLAGNLTFFNDSLCRMLGYSRDEMMGMNNRQYMDKQGAKRVFREFNRVYTTGKSAKGFDWEIIRKDGVRRITESPISLIKNSEGEPIGFRGIARDVTERKRAEEALRESEERLRLVVQNMPIMLAAFDTNGNFIIWNQECERVTGYKADEIVGNPKALELLYQGEAYLQGVLTEWAKRGDAFRDWELELTSRDGNVRTVSWFSLSRLFPIPGWDSWAIGVDITEHKRAEEELRKHREHLEELVKERTAELESFAYSISHDLRAPLRAMQGFSQALLEDYADRLDPVGQDYVHRIAAAAERLDTMIWDLLVYSHLSLTELHLQPVNLEGVVQGALSLLEADIWENDAQVTVEKPLLEPLGHHATLMQVVENLLSNAIRFVAPGVQPQVHVWAEERKEWMRLWVEDNGIGIARDHQGRIFNIFERLHGIETYPGTGVGLAIVRKGMKRMRGRVGVESEVGEGSRFWVELPKAEKMP